MYTCDWIETKRFLLLYIRSRTNPNSTHSIKIRNHRTRSPFIRLNAAVQCSGNLGVCEVGEGEPGWYWTMCVCVRGMRRPSVSRAPPQLQSQIRRDFPNKLHIKSNRISARLRNSGLVRLLLDALLEPNLTETTFWINYHIHTSTNTQSR